MARTPCYGLSELRRLRTRKIPDLQHLVNVIAFPKHGRRPLTNTLSGGDLDCDLYFVSWDETLTLIDNSSTLIDYPNSSSPQDTITSGRRFNNADSIRAELAENFARQCLSTESSIGLMHYSLLSMYDSSRTKMQTREYTETVININRVIDQQQKIEFSTKPFFHNPKWYLLT